MWYENVPTFRFILTLQLPLCLVLLTYIKRRLNKQTNSLIQNRKECYLAFRHLTLQLRKCIYSSKTFQYYGTLSLTIILESVLSFQHRISCYPSSGPYDKKALHIVQFDAFIITRKDPPIFQLLSRIGEVADSFLPATQF